MTTDTPQLTLPATWIGNAWIPVWAATSQDSDRTVLYRTVAIEWFTGQGIRIIACDSYVLLTAWIGVSEERPAPPIDEKPDYETVVSDHDRRGFGLIRYATSCARADDDAEGLYHRIKLNVTQPAGSRRTPALAESLEQQVLAISYEGEVVELPIVESPYVTWRTLIPTEGESVAQVAMTPHVLGILAKTGVNFAWRFKGELGPIALESLDGISNLSGIAMPARPGSETIVAEDEAA